MREAIYFIEKTEKERMNLIKHIADETKDVGFDLTIDLSRNSSSDVIAIIRFVAQNKGLLAPIKSKVEVF